MDIACWAAITLSGLYYFAILPFRASLVGTHPIVLVLLNGSTEGIVSAAAFARVDHGTLAWVLLAAIPGLMKFDLIFWWAGRLWGERIIHVFAGQQERSRRRAREICGASTPLGPLVHLARRHRRPVPAVPQRDHLWRWPAGRECGWSRS